MFYNIIILLGVVLFLAGCAPQNQQQNQVKGRKNQKQLRKTSSPNIPRPKAKGPKKVVDPHSSYIIFIGPQENFTFTAGKQSNIHVTSFKKGILQLLLNQQTIKARIRSLGSAQSKFMFKGIFKDGAQKTKEIIIPNNPQPIKIKSAKISYVQLGGQKIITEKKLLVKVIIKAKRPGLKMEKIKVKVNTCGHMITPKISAVDLADIIQNLAPPVKSGGGRVL